MLRRMMHRTSSLGPWVFVVLGSACGGSSGGASSGKDAGPVSSPDAAPDSSSKPPHDGASPSDGPAPSEAASACVPAIPQVAWTSPYAGWSGGIPPTRASSRSRVWLQQSFARDRAVGAGVNIYVGNNAGTDPLMRATSPRSRARDVRHHRAGLGGLASIDDPTIVGWWMTPTSRTTRSRQCGGGYGPPVAPATLVTQYDAYKKADPTRPHLSRPRAGRRLPRLRGAGQQSRRRSRVRPRQRHRRLRHLSVQQLRR
jgi:hypothetical protein